MTNQTRRLAALAKQGDGLQIQARDGSATRTPEVLLYDAIGAFGVTAKDFVNQLDQITAEDVTVRVNSPGGDVYDGLAMYAALQRHPAKVTVVVEGLAASAASIVAMAGDEIVMAPHAEMLVHDAWGMCVGNAADMTAMAADLNRVSDNLAGIYADRTNGDVKAWRKTLKAETWLSAQEAVDAGLADRIDAPQTADAPKAWDLSSIFAYAGRDAAPTPHLPSASAAGSAPPSGGTAKEGAAVAFSPEQLAHLRAAVGVPADADAATIVTAVDEALEERAVETPAVQTENTPTAPAVPDGMVMVDQETLRQLQESAELGRQAHEEQAQARRVQTVQAAVNDGRIPPARAEHWVAQLAADPGAVEVLNAMPKGLIPVTEVGHAEPRDEDVKPDAYAAIYGTKEA